ncbi:MAG: PfkB family carbohydrate kinase [Alphaproteobacteria bacterium]|nr:PfkB family carbohydrate kinase [Alphaproteobacteria bacterium]
MSLVILGTLAFDAIETPYGKTDKIVGGAALYNALAAINYCPVNLISVIGDDFPKLTLNMLSEKQINLDGVEVKKGEKTFFWACKYHNDMNHRDTLQTDLNVLANFEPHVPSLYQQNQFLMLGNLMPSIQRTVILQYPKRPCFVAMDTMNFWIEHYYNDLIETLKLVDCLFLNDSEAKLLTQEVSLVAAAKKIMSLGPKYVIVKKGEHGAILFHKDFMFCAPAIPLELVFDPTGCGDTFAGGFMGYLAQQKELNKEVFKMALIQGTAAASYCIEKFGIERLTEINLSDIQSRVEALKEMTAF